MEAWGEKYLAGKRGGRIVITGPDGTERKTIKEIKSEPADDIVTTIDLDVQLSAAQSLGDKWGSVVVIDPANGGILAMVSNPTFDPNQFILGMSDQQWTDLNDQTKRPLENRATQQAYPIGSTFKVVTMTAGMQSLGLTPQSTFNCPASFSLPNNNQVWHDWSANGQGTLTLHNALVQSCDTVFYQIAEQLDKKDSNILPDAAKAFGFGSETGLPELPETAGTVPDPTWKLQAINDYWARGDAINLSIGQGYFLATPLQVADAYAAIANGGTLWQPYLVQEVKSIDGKAVYTAQPKERGKLPATAEQLAAIRSALAQVTTAPNDPPPDCRSPNHSPVRRTRSPERRGPPRVTPRTRTRGLPPSARLKEPKWWPLPWWSMAEKEVTWRPPLPARSLTPSTRRTRNERAAATI